MKYPIGTGAVVFSIAGLAFFQCIAQAYAGESATQTAVNRDRLSYGSRAGMQVTITGRSGINSNEAVISLEHTRENAKYFCVEYNLDNSEQCVDKTLADVKVQPYIKANCKTGQFTNVWGGRHIFKGAAEGDDRPYEIEDEDGRMSQEHRSDYDVEVDNFKALCPARVAEADRDSQTAANADPASPDSSAQNTDGEQLSDARGVIYGEMSSESDFCRAFGHKTLLNLLSIYNLVKSADDAISVQISDEVNAWMDAKFKSVYSDNRDMYNADGKFLRLYFSDATESKVQDRLSNCTSKSQQAKEVLTGALGYTPGVRFYGNALSFDKGRSIELGNLVIMASLSDGLIALERILDGMTEQSDARVSELNDIAHEAAQAQSSFEAKLSDPAETLSDFYGTYKLISICYQNRTQYRIKYVDDDMMAESKIAIKSIEQRIISSSNITSSDQIWDNSVATYPIWRFDNSYRRADRIDESKRILDNLLKNSVTHEFSDQLDNICKNSVKMLSSQAGLIQNGKKISKDF